MWLNTRGIKFLCLIAPNKHNIYPQYVHSHLKRGKGISNGESLVNHLAKKIPRTMVNVFRSLRRESLKHQVYYKIDTHWNHRGGLVAASSIYKSIRRWFPGFKIKPFPKMRDVSKTISPGNFGRLMGIPLKETEAIPTPFTGWGWKRKSSAQLKKQLPINGTVRKYSNASAPPFKVLILGDSFITRINKYLAGMFSHSIFLSLFNILSPFKSRI